MFGLIANLLNGAKSGVGADDSSWLGDGEGGDGDREQVVGLPERGARRGRWKQAVGPTTALPGTAGMTPTHLGCWDIEQALWAHLWKEEEEECGEEDEEWLGGWTEKKGGGDGDGGDCGGVHWGRVSEVESSGISFSNQATVKTKSRTFVWARSVSLATVAGNVKPVKLWIYLSLLLAAITSKILIKRRKSKHTEWKTTW